MRAGAASTTKLRGELPRARPLPSCERSRSARRQDAEKPPRDDRPGIVRIASNLQGDVLGFAHPIIELRVIGTIGQHKQAGLLDGVHQWLLEVRRRLFELGDLSRQFLGLLLGFVCFRFFGQQLFARLLPDGDLFVLACATACASAAGSGARLVSLVLASTPASA